MRVVTRLTVIIAATALTLAVAASALASTVVPVYLGVGIDGAHLGMRDVTAARHIEKFARLTASGLDRSFPKKRVVYAYGFGLRMRSGMFPLRMFANQRRTVFAFEVNTGAYRTLKGIRVGSSEIALVRAYGRALILKNLGASKSYTIKGGNRTLTQFWVRAGTVFRIGVSSY